MYNPLSTYRVQFHKDFTFQHFIEVIPYLHELGVTTIYASPIFTAVPGSTHGYDGLNPHSINPEIGTEEELFFISKQLKKKGIGWVQDIVPNHMAFDTRNLWLADVLEKGAQSYYNSFFDIAWHSSIYEGKLMVPFLGASLDETIIKGELKIVYENNRLQFKYYDALYPLHLRSYTTVFSAPEEGAPEVLQHWLQTIEHLLASEWTDTFSATWDACLQQLTQLVTTTKIHTYLSECLAAVNNSNEALHYISAQQVYRLCHWQETASHINYRRFFTVNGLICLNIQHPHVFQEYHKYIFYLIQKGVFQGLRIDHIDGLYDPAYYLEELRQNIGDETYLIVEKILEKDETLPLQWPIQGTSGYEYLATVNNLLTNKAAEAKWTRFYYNLVREYKTVPQQIREKKSFILYHHMGGELENLYQTFMELVHPEDYATFRTEDIKTAIAEALIHCRVYRFYGNRLPLSNPEAAQVQQVFNQVKETRPDLSAAVGLLENKLLYGVHQQSEVYNCAVLNFYKKCMQLAGPLMAKGVEDTLMYTFNRFIGHNEVGDAPDAFGISTDEFHAAMKKKGAAWPLSLNATSTHDTKRGEDVRARLNALTDLGDEWLQKITEWQGLNKPLKYETAPDANDEYLIYQTLIGSYPLDEEVQKDYVSRLTGYLQKALREAKQHSNWTTPNTAYEEAVIKFATGLLDKEKPFWKSFYPFFQKVADGGIMASLTQTILKCTTPGVPDIYQGCEMWDLSLVDPDNRRPVDFLQPFEILQQINNSDEKIINQLWESRADARIKLWLTQKLLQLRQQHQQLFEQGTYVPLQVQGAYKNHVFAFARVYRSTCLIVAVPLYTNALCKAQNSSIKDLNWGDTSIELPKESSGAWKSVLSFATGEKDEILVQDIFKRLPFAIIERAAKEKERGAGILLHITSLASPFGIGDLGPKAHEFANFLYGSKQKYWQVLPINPTEGGQGHSPYSATSSRAGNVLLISPELLADEGLLNTETLAMLHLPQTGITDFDGAEKLKSDLFSQAWEAFKKRDESLNNSFNLFCTKEKEWLDDFAFYTLLKKIHNGKPWYEWPEHFKLHNTQTLEGLATEHQDELQKTKWLQFIFNQQWQSLKEVCNKKGISLIGDLPFYVSYDSADVWANRAIFSLDADGGRTGLAGVPPDDFSADGQLWGMPVFRWDVLEKQGYSWWIERLQKNMELFDLIRLDHFRAFADYWEVPAGANTAKDGKWMPGPGAAFFSAVEKALGKVPFVAEDLGEINSKVFKLRDDFSLPGMKVLQFAFGGDFQTSDYMPHNYTHQFFVYTGTHDNNTTRGWYRIDADETVRQNINLYAGRTITEEEIAPFFCRLAFSSVAKTAILPVQDILGLDESARMNTPASSTNNWAWRLAPHQLSSAAQRTLKEWTITYNRS